MNRQPYEPSTADLQARMEWGLRNAQILWRDHMRAYAAGAPTPGAADLRVLLTYATSPGLSQRFGDDLSTAIKAWRTVNGSRSMPNASQLLVLMDATAEHRSEIALEAMMGDEEPESVLTIVEPDPDPEPEVSAEAEVDEADTEEPEEGKATADKYVRAWLTNYGTETGVVDLSLLDGWTRADVMALPGMGAKLCDRVEAALAAQGMTLA